MSLLDDIKEWWRLGNEPKQKPPSPATPPAPAPPAPLPPPETPFQWFTDEQAAQTSGIPQRPGELIEPSDEEHRAQTTLPPHLIAPMPPVTPVQPPGATEPAQTTADTLLPAGTVTSLRPYNQQPFNIPWENATRWTPLIDKALAKYPAVRSRLGDDVYRFYWSLFLIESDGNQFWPSGPNKGKVVEGGDSYGGCTAKGIMQIKDCYHQWLDPTANWRTAEGNILLGTAFLTSKLAARGGDWAEVIRKDYHPGTSPNGTTPESYVKAVRDLIAEAKAKTQPGPDPKPDVDPLAVIVGGSYPPITYGWLADEGLDYYGYGVGHGTTKSTQHPGVDIGVPCGANLFVPAPGVVDCVGGNGTPRWGQSCGAYADVDGHGVGNVTILLDGGVKLTLGHCRTSFVVPGQRVTAGQKVATVGSMNGCHVHVETSVERNGTYWLVEPVAALRGLTDPKGDRAGYVHHGDVPGAPNGLWLPEGLKFRKHILPASQKNQRPGNPMTPRLYIQHETGNPKPGANADNHLTYLRNGAPDNNGVSQQLGYHLTVDKDEAILMIPLDEITWHGGDGSGACNMTGIACELTVEDNNKNKVKARANAEALAAAVMESKGIERNEQHNFCSGKNCPQYIRQDGYWPTYLANVQAHRVRIRGGGPPPPPKPKYDGLTIPEAVFEALFLDPKAPADPNGLFTKFMASTGFHYPVHRLVREGNVSYLITGGGVLRAKDGKVEKLS